MSRITAFLCILGLAVAAAALPSAAARAAEQPAPPAPAGKAAAQPQTAPPLNMNSVLYGSYLRAGKAPVKKSGGGKFAEQPNADETELIFSFGDDAWESRATGGLDKDSSTGSVGLRQQLDDNWHIGGGAVFDGKARGAQADIGFKW